MRESGKQASGETAKTDKPAKHPTILVVDDDDRDREFLRKLFSERGYEVVVSGSGREALEIVRERGDLDIVLADSDMPEMGGIEVCEKVRAFPLSRYIPVVLATLRPALAERVPDPDTGADDYVSKPYLQRELLARIHTLLRVKALEDEILRLTTTDLMTGLSNRRYLLKRLEEEISRARRYTTPIACFLADIDHFRAVNDAFGHRFGDEVILQLGHILARHVRREDILGLWGGEEFFAILPESQESGAYILAERIRSEVEGTWFEYEGASTRLTISIGVTGYAELPTEMGLDRFVKEAEVSLGQAKKQGGNRVVVFSRLSRG